jgi:PAS domain S-box-containing protein
MWTNIMASETPASVGNSDITKRLWPAGIPSGAVQFPNVTQVNQLWTVALAGAEKNQQQARPAIEDLFEDTRKHKNRIFAKRTREKRKNENMKLEEEFEELKTENQRLRNLVKTKLPGHAQKIIKQCCSDHPLHQAAAGSSQQTGAGPREPQDLIGSDFRLIENLIKGRQSFVITDPAQADNPIVYASEAFYTLTGYTKDIILGRNCRILQGQNTDLKAVKKIRNHIENGRDTSVNLLNYKADGTPFWNQFFIAPLRNRDKKIVNYVRRQTRFVLISAALSHSLPLSSFTQIIGGGTMRN